MLTRSKKKQRDTEHLQHLYISTFEHVKKNRLRKRHPDYIYTCLKQRYSSKGENLIIM